MEEALSEAEAEAKAEECVTEKTAKAASEAEKDAAQKAAEETKLEADFWASFAEPPKPTVRNEPSMNFVEGLTSSPLSEREMLIAEYIAAKRRLSSPIAPITHLYPQKVAPSAQTTPEDAINKSEAFSAEATEIVEVDQSDWQIHPRIFYRYNAELGPFDVDAACDLQGKNAFVPTYWTLKDDLTQQDWAHQNT